MIPVHQTIFGDGTGGSPRGNCFAACIASLLDLSLELVPNFCEVDDWRGATDRFLAPLGLFYLDVVFGEGVGPGALASWGYHVMSGPGPRDCRHSVVGRAGVMVHDPHPSGAGLVVAEEYGLLVPVDPAWRLG